MATFSATAHGYQRLRIHRFVDGRDVGLWSDPIFGLDTSYCYRAELGRPDPWDATLSLDVDSAGHIRAVSTAAVAEDEQQDIYWLTEDATVRSELRVLPTQHDPRGVTARWSWFDSGSLEWASLEFNAADTLYRRPQASVYFNEGGLLDQLSVTRGFWEHSADAVIGTTRWLPRRPEDIIALQPSSSLRIGRFEQSSTELASFSSSWLAGAESTDSIVDYDYHRGRLVRSKQL